MLKLSKKDHKNQWVTEVKVKYHWKCHQYQENKYKTWKWKTNILKEQSNKKIKHLLIYKMIKILY